MVYTTSIYHDSFQNATQSADLAQNALGNTREQRVPGSMVLSLVGPCFGEPTFQYVQRPDRVDVELFPSMRRTTATLATDLKAEQKLHATANAVVMRFDDSDLSDSAHELDQTLVGNRTHELVIRRSKEISVSYEGVSCGLGST